MALSNRAIAEQLERTGEEEGLEPVKYWVADLINELISVQLGADDLEFAWIEENEVDQEKQAKILSTLADSGVLTLNQCRERLGEEPDPDPMAAVLAVKTASGRIPIGNVAKTDDKQVLQS